MTDTAITVYLDSNDYSTLSDPLSIERSHFAKMSTRKREANSWRLGQVQELYANLVDAVCPSTYAPAATARADLLVALCGRNAFISFDRLIKLELSRFVNPDAAPIKALSNDADWFPELDDVISPLQWADTAREIDKAVRERGINREHRRALKRQLFKANQPKPMISEWLANQDVGADLSDILRLYPMRPQDAKVLGRYVLGRATATEAQEAFLESLRDPRWMMRWFAAHHDRLTPVNEWLRGPSRNMTTRMKEMAAGAKELRRFEAIPGSKFSAEMLTSAGWRSAQDELLLNVANRLLAEFHPESLPIGSTDLVDRNCPGLSATIRSLHSALWDSVGGNPRTPQESDFVDAVHAMYAPYVTFFRADRYMSPHIQKQWVIADPGCLSSRNASRPNTCHASSPELNEMANP
jgi:hypothetical protein